MTKLSVLIPSVPERFDSLKRIYNKLLQQAKDKPIEILVLMDNKKRTTGAKRNALIEQAKGDFVAFVDDDDQVSEDYIPQLFKKIQEVPSADCIVFDVEVYLDGDFDKVCKYGKEYQYKNTGDFYYRKPNHLMCFRRHLANFYKYKDISMGEDTEWSNRAVRSIQKQVRINKSLYQYKYVSKPREWYFEKQDYNNLFDINQTSTSNKKFNEKLQKKIPINKKNMAFEKSGIKLRRRKGH